MDLITLSGGQSSAFMLYCMLEFVNKNDFIICFADTGLEHKMTYKFLDNIEENWLKPKGMYIHRVAYKDTFKDLVLKYKYPPNRVARYCTDRLKIKAIDNYLKKINVKINYKYIGIRYDEIHRKREGKNKYPLIDLKKTIKDVDYFFEKNNFKLEIPRYKGNCVGCFLKSLNKLIKIAQEEPDYLDFFLWAEEETGFKFRKDYSYKEIIKISKLKSMQLNLFDDNSINCVCTD